MDPCTTHVVLLLPRDSLGLLVAAAGTERYQVGAAAPGQRNRKSNITQRRYELVSPIGVRSQLT